MKLQIKAVAKEAGMTALEVGTVAGAMILTKKLLDFNILFKNKIASDPTFAQGFFIKHQGGIRFAAGLAGAAYFKNPWVKLAFIGIAAEGLITEVRALTTDAAGVAFFDKIGQADTRVTDDELLQLAAQYDNQMGATNPTTQYPTYVAWNNPTTQYPTTVSGKYNQPGVDLTRSIPMYTAGKTNYQVRKTYAA